MVQLGGLLETGRGIQPDFRQAFALYSIASKGGYKPATEKLESLRSKLSPEHLKAAEAFTASASGNQPASPKDAGSTAKPASTTPPKASPKPGTPAAKPSPKTTPKPAAKPTAKPTPKPAGTR